MPRLITLTLGLLMVAGCGSSKESVQAISVQMRPYVPEGWSMAVSNNTVRIATDFDVALIGRVSRPPYKSMEQLAADYGRRTKYDIAFTFVPLLAKEDYSELKAKRAPFLYTLDHGAIGNEHTDGKTLYGIAMIGYATNKVPTFFTADYSIFVDRPIDRFVETFPSNAFVQAEVMLSGLGDLFHRYDD